MWGGGVRVWGECRNWAGRARATLGSLQQVSVDHTRELRAEALGLSLLPFENALMRERWEGAPSWELGDLGSNTG